MPNIPQETNPVKEEKPLSYLHQGVLNYLTHFRNYLYRYDRLAPDNSFYRADKTIAKKFWVSRVTVWEIKKELKRRGLIDYKSYSGAGKATVYWILDDFKPRERNEESKKVAKGRNTKGFLWGLIKDMKKPEARQALSRYHYPEPEIEEVIKDLEG